MIAGINVSKTLIKHRSCECKCKFDGRKCSSNQKWNNNKSWCECKNLKEHVCGKDHIWNPATYSCENGKYLAGNIDNSVIKCDEIIEETETISTKIVLTKTVPTKTIETNFNEKR